VAATTASTPGAEAGYGALAGTQRSTGHGFALEATRRLTPRSRRTSGVNSLDLSDLAPERLLSQLLTRVDPIVAFGGAALGVFAWSHIRVHLLAELVDGAVAAGAFLLTHSGALPAGAAPVRRRPGGRTAPAGSRL
jgi:hypothetical protein